MLVDDRPDGEGEGASDKDPSGGGVESGAKAGPKRKLRVLSGKRAFKRCRKCRSVNPILATVCLKCGNLLDDANQEETRE